MFSVEKDHQFFQLINVQYTNGNKCTYGVFLSMKDIAAMSSSVRIRGGAPDNPNADEKTNEIPYLKDSRFFWNGLPCIDFIEVVMFPLENGLASMSVKGYSLLDAINRTDAGGVLAHVVQLHDEVE